MRILQNIVLLFILMFSSAVHAQTFEKTFSGQWAMTSWTFEFHEDGTFVRTSTGHFGNPVYKGNYIIQSDSIHILSGFENTSGTLNEYYLLDKDSMLIDLNSLYDYAPNTNAWEYISHKRYDILKKAHWKTLNTDEYFIQYPDDWQLDESGRMGTVFVLFSPLSSSQDLFKENVNLLIQDISTYELNLDQYTEISEGQIKSMITDSKIIESKREHEGSDEFHKMIYTGRQGKFNLTFEQYFWVENGKAYVLTFTCEQERFSEFKELGESIMSSFLIKN